jgi:hypothetical protein
MADPGPWGLVTALLAVIGALCFSLGLGELLCGRRGVATVPEWVPSAILLSSDPAPAALAEYRRLTDTIDDGAALPPKLAAPFPLNAGKGLPSPGESGPSSLSPQPATHWQAVVLAPAGRWGAYHQAIGRCDHEHPDVEGAIRCGLELPGRPEGGLVAAEMLA